MGYSMAIEGVQAFDAYHQDNMSGKVLKVLKDYLGGEELNKAMNLWEGQYSQQPLDKLSYFIFELESNADLRSNRRELLRKLEHELKNAPPEQVKKAVHARPQYSKPVEPTETLPVVQAEVLASFIKLLSETLSGAKAEDLLEIYGEYLEETTLPSFIKEEMLVVAIENQLPQHMVFEENSVRQMINMLYSAICEYLGPVKADRLLARAIDETAQSYPSVNMAKFL